VTPPLPEDRTGGLRRRVRVAVPLEEPGTGEPEVRPRRRLRVGLLGGSFNPAHEGHLYASIEALKRLRLDQIWWLVSPQNPLKPVAGMAPLAQRLARARELASHPRIKVTALEERLHTRYTVDTLRRLASWRDHDFVWLVGADNLLQMPRWRRWTRILETAPIAVVERHPYSYRSMAGPAAGRYRRERLPDARAHELAALEPPVWTFLRLRPHPASSTALRRGAGGVGRPGHDDPGPSGPGNPNRGESRP
jgi:nicotinate-nucleotide adenylyltransferase